MQAGLLYSYSTLSVLDVLRSNLKRLNNICFWDAKVSSLSIFNLQGSLLQGGLEKLVISLLGGYRIPGQIVMAHGSVTSGRKRFACMNVSMLSITQSL